MYCGGAHAEAQRVGEYVLRHSHRTRDRHVSSGVYRASRERRRSSIQRPRGDAALRGAMIGLKAMGRALLALLCFVSPVAAQQRPPLLPEPVVAALANELSGDRTLAT